MDRTKTDIPRRVELRHLRFAVTAISVLGVPIVLLTGCPGLGIGTVDKQVSVTFRVYDVGLDDCDEALFPPTDYGDFTIDVRVTRLPINSQLLWIMKTPQIGFPIIGEPLSPYNFTPNGSFVTFTVGMDDGFEIRGTISESDEFPELETSPTPWNLSRIFNYGDLENGSKTIIFSSGPGCFSDDSIEVRIDVADAD